MAHEMIFDRVELAQPHEYSWPAAPVHANIPVRKSIHHKNKWSHKPQIIRTVNINIFGSCFFLFHRSRRIGVLTRNFHARKKNKNENDHSFFLCPIRVGLTHGIVKADMTVNRRTDEWRPDTVVLLYQVHVYVTCQGSTCLELP